MLISAYVIHLQRAAGRKENVRKLEECLPVPVKVVPAVDNQALAPEMLARHVRRQIHKPRYPFPLSANEAACFLSHRAAWSAIVADGVDAGLVLEDDAQTTPDFEAAFELARDALRQGHYIRFPHRDGLESGVTVSQQDKHRLFIPIPVGLGTVAQLVTRDAAIRLLEKTERFDRPLDVLLQMHWITGVRPYSLCPSGIREISETLGGSLLKRKKSLSAKLQHEILRPLYRRKIRLLSS